MEALVILFGMISVFGGLFMLFAAVVGTIAFYRQGQYDRRLKSQEFELATLRAEVAALSRRGVANPPATTAIERATEVATPTAEPAAVAVPQSADIERSAGAGVATGTAASAVTASITATAEPPPDVGFEQRLGASWTVWAGGLALALGAIFLVRYSIERGLIGPGLRIALGALAAGLLGTAGELLRRRQLRSDATIHPIADIPAVLTGAGVIAAFATTYAAFSLYQFLNPVTAFLIMAAIGLAGLALSALHGSGIAALGLVGSYATPALVGGETPNPWSLFGYLAAVTAASYLLAYLRGWLWLAIAATAAAVAWALLWFAGTYEPAHATALASYIGVLTLLALAFLGSGDAALTPVLGPPAERKLFAMPAAATRDADGEPSSSSAAVAFDWPLILIVVAIADLAFCFVRMDGFATTSLVLLAFMTVVLFGAAARQWSLVPLAAVAAALFFVSYLGWHLPAVLPDGAVTFSANAAGNLYAPPALQSFLIVGTIFAAGIGLAGFLVLSGPRPHEVFAAVTALTPLATLAYAHWRGVDFTRSVPFGAVALLLAVAYAVMVEVLDRRRGDRRIDWSVGALAAAAAAAMALAVTMVLERGWLTVALSLLAPALAWISLKRPIGVLRPLVAAVALLVVGRLLWEPRIVGSLLGSTPIFNWLLYGYGIPALAFATAGYFLRRDRDDQYVAAAEATSLTFAVALVCLQLRHLINAGDVFAGGLTLFEAGLQTSTALAMAIGLNVANHLRGRVVLAYGWQVLTTLALLAALFVLLLSRNPLFTNIEIAGGALFNDLMIAYALPAMLAGLLYWRLRGQAALTAFAGQLPPRLASRIVGAAAIVLGFAYLSLETMRIFQGPMLSFGRISEELSYALSAVWLVFAIVLLAAGIFFKAAPLRHAAFAVLLVVVLKVFLFDMAGLTGLLRALSFLGLGVVLVGIGYAYQRLVLPAAPKALTTS